MPSSTTLNSFMNLLETTEDLDMLLELQKHLSNRIEKVSESGSRKSVLGVKDDKDLELSINLKIVSDNNTNSSTVDLNNFVRYQDSFLPLTKTLEKAVETEAKTTLNMSRISGNQIEYLWLSKHKVNYSFGGRTLIPKKISEFTAISELLGLLNTVLDCSLDSCLISCYKNSTIKLPPHCDDEDIIDQTHVICNVSIGTERTINFYKFSDKTEPILSQKLSNGSLLLMLPGCQGMFKHGIQPENQEALNNDQFRLCLSFRKVVVPNAKNDNAESATMPLYFNGYQTQQQQQHGKIPPFDIPKEHLIIGDSLTRGIDAPNTITVTKGGCVVSDILEILKNSDELHPSEYHKIRTVTVCVGTNSLSKAHVPLLAVMSDYDKLIRDLSGIFPEAVIGMFNVPPRKYSNIYHLCRIKSFNNFLYDLENVYKNTVLINLFWEYITPNGYLNLRFFDPRDHLHMSDEGKGLMRHAVFGFQSQQALYRPTK